MGCSDPPAPHTHQCSLGTEACYRLFYADARYIDGAIVSKAEAAPHGIGGGGGAADRGRTNAEIDCDAPVLVHLYGDW